MKRLLLLSIVCLTAAATVGCSFGRNSCSRCRLFSGFRGAPCDACTSAPVVYQNPCAAPVYSQSIPAYGGDCCSSMQGFDGYAGYGDVSGYGAVGSYGAIGGYGGGCSSCGEQYAPGMVIPGEGMIIDGGQIPSLPGGSLSPQTVPAPQAAPIPQATPGPAAGN